MRRYRLLVIIAFLALLVSTLFFQRGEAQKQSQSRAQSQRAGRSAGGQDNTRQESGVPIAGRAVNFAESLPVRDLPEVKMARSGFKFAVREIDKEREEKRARNGQGPGGDAEAKEINETNREVIRRVDSNAPRTPDAALSSKTLRRNGVAPKVPNPPTVSFEGISIAETIPLGQGFLPPDTNGDVGPNHYVQTVNVAFRVWDKTGMPLTPVASLNTLFGPLGAPCGSSEDGDPIVLYDQLADRWLISQFCTVANPNNHQLIAISRTGDPTGSYYLYDFMMPNNKFNDYPHFGMWPDAYYMTDNQFNQAGTAFLGGGRFAFDRAKMLVGDPTAGFVYFDSCPTNTGCVIGGELPSDLDGLTPPPAGAPNVFAFFTANEFGDPADAVRLFDFHVDFATPANSTFTERTGSPLAVAAFDPVTVPNSRNVVPQPPPATASSFVDAINDRLMFRLAYRNFGTSESLIANHTVNAAVNPAYRAAVRFYQLSRATPAAAFTVTEQQTFSGAGGDTSHRWMGSGAMNFQGDIALGYSVSSSTVFPSIRYAAKLNTDPPGSGLAQGEQNIIAGAGSQTSTSGRWGDYSDLTVDPSDDCSFWYTQEYYPVSSEPGNATAPWHTRIAKFAPGPCATSPRGTISGTITNCQTMLPIPNALISITGGFSRTTIANGTYSATVPPSTYNATATAPGYDPVSQTGLVVANGGSATFSACLNGTLKQPVADTGTVTADACNSNMVIDPNEAVTVSLGIKNTGTLDTVNLVGTLQATGGVTIPSGPQSYGVVVAGGPTVFRSFTFTAGNLACGSTLVATLDLQDGMTSLGTISYNFVTGVISVNNYSTGNIAVAIPDNNATGVDIPITVADVMTLTDVNVSFRLNHTFDGDLNISLIHPDNTVVPLVSRRGGAGDNFGTGANDCSGTGTQIDDQAGTAITAGMAPFSGSFRPESPLSALNGKPSNGTWRLRVADVAALDTGTVGCVKLELNKRFVCCGALINATTPVTITAENAVPLNNAPDPGETLTVSLPLINVGGNDTTNLMATLQATGGVTNPSGPQNYGIVMAGGAAVARNFTFTASSMLNCGDNITLTLALQDGATNLGTINYTLRVGTTVMGMPQTFSNTTAILIPGGQPGTTTGVAAPYPSNITVSGVVGAVAKVTVGLKQFNHTFPDDVDVLLVSPTGQKMIIMSDVGGNPDAVNADITLDDAAASLLPDSTVIATGTFRPTNIGTGDTFAAPAPAAPYLSAATAGTDTLNSAFAPQDPNGTWSLYVVDDLGGDFGNFNGGWEITFTTTANVCSMVPTTTAVTSSVNPSVFGQAVTFTATVSPIPSGGSVDFVIDGNPAASGLPLNGLGQASFMTSALTVAGSPHTVTANYSGNPIFGPSSGSLAGGQTVNAPGTGSPQNWTSAGSSGATDEDSIGKLTNQDFVVSFAAGQTGTATVRYNITATKGITAFCPATQSTVSVRFRNSDITGLHTRVKFEIRRTNITSGGNQIIYTFNSDGLSNGSNFLSSTATPAIDFDFASNVYWIEATIFRDDPNLFADLGLIQIFESGGTPCP